MSRVCKRGHASSALPGGRDAHRRCKECKTLVDANYYVNNRERLDTYRAGWYRKNTARAKANVMRWRRENPVTRMLIGARRRAKELGIECTITHADIVIPERCPWLDIPLVSHTGMARPDSPSLDRIIPAIGYVRGNIIVISNRANTIKSNATPEQLARVLAGLRSVYPDWLPT